MQLNINKIAIITNNTIDEFSNIAVLIHSRRYHYL